MRDLGPEADKFGAFALKYPKAMGNVICGAECGDGWLPLLDPVLAECEATGTEVHQVKEKFGRLRIYVGEAPQSVYEAIEKAQDASGVTCEDCGAPGKLTTDKRWSLTLCPTCTASKGRK